MRWHNSTAAPGSSNIDTYRYRYNKNNWLSGADFGTSNASSAVSFAQNANNDYRVDNITYDANGNIKTLKRNKQTQGGNAMDDLTYTYDGTKKNRLVRVDDAVGPVAGADDIEDQSGINYVYDAIGRLTENVSEGLKYTYNTGGLVTEIKKNNVTLVRFSYNDRGHRVGKEIYTGGSLTRSDRYVRDASGSVLAVYEGAAVKEHALYGLGRLGVYYRAGGTYAYQLADHLGNVRAVVMKDGAGALAVTNRTDYYPGGMAMPGRSIVGDYRYDYQGQEKDRETGHNAFELRMYDSRINRWLTKDPKREFFSPYLAMANNWINTVDPDGGCTDCPDPPISTIVLDEVVISASRGGSPSSFDMALRYPSASLTTAWGVREFYYKPNVTNLKQYYGSDLATRTAASIQRNAYTEATRKMLPPEWKAFSEAKKGTYKVYPNGSFAKPNSGVMTQAKVGGAIGVVGIAYGGYQSYEYINNASNKQHATIHEAASWTGSLAGGWVGAKTGIAIGGAIGSVIPFVGTAVGGFVGGVIGGVVGSYYGGQEGSAVARREGYIGY